MAAGESCEGIELNTIAVQCVVSRPLSDIEDEEDIGCLPSEVAGALPTQTK